ncbi:MAG: hypothetical protein R6X20_00790 [Phycisphaerae bacterium]
MGQPAVKRPGLSDIRTLSGTVEETFRPHKAFLRVACLEMEKTRRMEERQAAAQRIERIDRHIRAIDAEKETLLGRLREAGQPVSSADPGGAPAADRPKGQAADGFKVRY